MKLVRDLIPQIIEDSGEKCKYHIARDNEYEARLHAKMLEELGEFRRDPNVEEASDILEVFTSLCRFHNINLDEVSNYADEKRANRGGFNERIILHVRKEPQK